MALRRRLDTLGFGIAEAMDTAQRFELGWPGAERLIRECGALHLDHGFVAGVATDHLDRVEDLDQLVEGVAHQARVVFEAGGYPVLLPLPWLLEQGLDEEGFVDALRPDHRGRRRPRRPPLAGRDVPRGPRGVLPR